MNPHDTQISIIQERIHTFSQYPITIPPMAFIEIPPPSPNRWPSHCLTFDEVVVTQNTIVRGNEHEFASCFDVHQGTRVLKVLLHGQIARPSQIDGIVCKWGTPFHPLFNCHYPVRWPYSVVCTYHFRHFRYRTQISYEVGYVFLFIFHIKSPTLS